MCGVTPRHEVTIIVRPSTSRRFPYPLTAYIAGTQIEGVGHTVVAAVEDLFTSAAAGKVVEALERTAKAMERA